jgi:hypothetical protein
MEKLTELDEAWRTRSAGARLEAIRAAAPRLKERLHRDRAAKSVVTRDLITLPYPTRYGLCDAHRSIVPYLMITNRMQLVEVATDEGVKRLLVNPSDHERDGAGTPFFARLQAGMPEFVNKLVARRHGTVPSRLAELGVDGNSIDWITFDHLHTQDLRRLMTEWCPRAKLLVQKDELDIFHGLHPLQRDWYCADGIAGLQPDRFVVLDHDVRLGEGVFLIRTPGHTIGNHSIVLKTERGLWTISENGVSVDNYWPERSEIGGLAGYARATGCEVVLNANTREHSLDQYTSMVLEKLLADPCPDGSGWWQVFPSSELTAHPLLPGLVASYSHKEISGGSPSHRA